jgi:hypothetical protein
VSIPVGAIIISTAAVAAGVLVVYSICTYAPPPPPAIVYCPSRGRVNAPPISVARPYVPPPPNPRTKSCTYTCWGFGGSLNTTVTIQVPISSPCPPRITGGGGTTCTLIGAGPIWN